MADNNVLIQRELGAKQEEEAKREALKRAGQSWLNTYNNNPPPSKK